MQLIHGSSNKIG